MDWLNYHHLFYFWTVARAGSIAAACEELLLAPPTISAQIHELEAALGERLFNRVGRNLALTETGRVVYRHFLIRLASSRHDAGAGGQRPRHATG